MATKKAGRPKGSNKKKVDSTQSEFINAELTPTNQELINYLTQETKLLAADVRRLQAEVDNLQHQATGYDAVISYLEHKLFGE
jgi:molecular chaperone GrpE (heat shock protein)